MQHGAGAERPMVASWGAPRALTALVMPTYLVHYIYKPLTVLESSYFYSKDTDEFKSTNVDKILRLSREKKKPKQIDVISPILQKVKLRLKRRSDFPGESTLSVSEVSFCEAASLCVCE